MPKTARDDLIVLIHSPLVGPSTWARVAQALRGIHSDVLVPVLADHGGTPPPYWQQHAASVREALQAVPKDRPLVLVGHSGAGPLLPLISQASGHPIAGYLFVDAGLPHPGKTRMDDMPEELRQFLTSGERFPNWADDDLKQILPDAGIRQQVLSEMQPRSLDFFEEILPGVPGWRERPAGYLLFSEGYRPDLEQAQKDGWPNRTIPSGHFHMLVDPAGVAAALRELMVQLREQR